MRLAVGQRDPGRCDLQIVGKQTNNCFIRFAVSWCCCRTYSQLSVADVENLVPTCPRLDPDTYHEIAARPIGGAIVAVAQIGNGRTELLSNIASACKAMMAKIGEISRPPMGRINTRNGRRTGSTSIEMNAVAGL